MNTIAYEPWVPVATNIVATDVQLGPNLESPREWCIELKMYSGTALGMVAAMSPELALEWSAQLAEMARAHMSAGLRLV